ncbi:MAG TPA: enoyl-CoA hydratase-related protein [Mycobacteriales bacterium]|nr:enoyl-CoA hydratase-related protein [Mycobacteriales bacterium]
MEAAAEMNHDPVTLEVADGVARLTLNRPDRMNTIDLNVARALAEAALQLDSRDDVRVVLLGGSGKTFCGGGDLKSFAEIGDGLPGHLREVTTHLHAAMTILSRIDAPIVAAVRGSAAGAGLGLVCAADVVIAAESTKFAFAYSAIGFTPDGGTSWNLPRLVGLRKAQELALTNRVIDAAEAERIGIVTTVVGDDELEAAADALVDKLAVAPTHALGITKRLLRATYDVSYEERLAVESVELSRSAGTPDGREGVAAFLEKRSPKFEGR